MTPNTKIVSIIILCLFIECIVAVRLQGGNLNIVVTEQHHESVEYSVKVNKKLSEQIMLTQSSKVKITAKVHIVVNVQLSFTEESFIPELVTFRLRHSTYENITEPVLAKYNSQDETFKAEIDLGNPVSYVINSQSLIKPFSSIYQLEVIVADEKMDGNARNVVADCKVEFRKSLETIPSSELHYRAGQAIETTAPAERVDPPKLFTLFVVLLIAAVDAIFVYGLNHLKVNVSFFTKSSVGFLLNVGFLVVLMANLAVLVKFWINWTFLDTLQCLLLLVLPTALIANYALVHVRKN